jgi:putative aldouronate transport system substrate-binding protein
MRTVHNSGSPRLSRRTFLAAIGAGAAATAGGSLLAGCSGGAAPAAKVVGDAELAKVVPAHIPVTLVQPDLPASTNVDPGFLNYPQKLVRSVAEKPGAGSSFRVMVGSFEPPPLALARNSYQQLVNDALGATVDFTYVPAGDHPAKLNTVLAGGDVPDMVQVFSWAIPSQMNAATNALFADLTDFLAGDRVKAYPNLANLPTRHWTASVFNRRLFALPLPSSPYGAVFFYRKDIFDARGLKEPTDAASFLALCKELTDAKRNQWATGNPYNLARWIYRVPSDWTRRDGKLVHAYETPEFGEAVAFARKVYEGGYVHPDDVAGQNERQKELFNSGKMAMYSDGIGAWQPGWDTNTAVNPSFRMQAMAPFAHDGGKPVVYADGTNVFYTFVNKKLPKEKIEELLRIANYVAAPLGTEEYLLVHSGQEGRHFTRDAGGVPVPTAQAKKELGFNFTAIAAPPVSVIDTAYPDFTRAYHAWQTNAAPHAVTSPVAGVHLDLPPQLNTIATKVEDTVNEVLRGRRPQSALTDAVSAWRSAGGDQLRGLYEQALGGQ